MTFYAKLYACIPEVDRDNAELIDYVDTVATKLELLSLTAASDDLIDKVFNDAQSRVRASLIHNPRGKKE